MFASGATGRQVCRRPISRRLTGLRGSAALIGNVAPFLICLVTFLSACSREGFGPYWHPSQKTCDGCDWLVRDVPMDARVLLVDEQNMYVWGKYGLVVQVFPKTGGEEWVLTSEAYFGSKMLDLGTELWIVSEIHEDVVGVQAIDKVSGETRILRPESLRGTHFTRMVLGPGREPFAHLVVDGTNDMEQQLVGLNVSTEVTEVLAEGNPLPLRAQAGSGEALLLIDESATEDRRLLYRDGRGEVVLSSSAFGDLDLNYSMLWKHGAYIGKAGKLWIWNYGDDAFAQAPELPDEFLAERLRPAGDGWFAHDGRTNELYVLDDQGFAIQAYEVPLRVVAAQGDDRFIYLAGAQDLLRYEAFVR